jgi:tight adherence protein B
VTQLNVLLGLAVLCMLGAAALLLQGGKGEQRHARGLLRLNSALARLESAHDFVLAPVNTGWLPPLLGNYLLRSGFDVNRRFFVLLALPGLVLLVFGLLLLGWGRGLLFFVVAYPLFVALFFNWRSDHFREQVVAQLPGFLDAISRILSVGCSLELAFRNAGEECQEPLRGIVSQVLLRTQAGLALEDAMSQVAESYAIRELNFMASVFYLGVRYGGNAQAILERITLTMRERLRSRKELLAMTAETRASAWILSALPVVVGLLTLSSNPGYLIGMWQDDSGRQLLLVAAGLQVCGMFLLFRMARLK